jgi:hypothetical protein
MPEGWTRKRLNVNVTGILCAVLLAFLSSGCAFGPRVLEKTYGPYYESIRHSDEEELLRNLVHMRYNESPGYLNVSSIAAQYELSGQAEARPFFLAPNPGTTPNGSAVFRTFAAVLPDLSASSAIRPTISFVPGDDGELLRRFLTPITAENLTFLIQTGWPVSALLGLWSQGLNGVPNVGPSDAAANAGAQVDRFRRLLELFQSAGDRELVSIRVGERVTEMSGALSAESATATAAVDAVRQGLELRQRPDGKSVSLIRRDRRLLVQVTPGCEQDPAMLEIERVLNLVPGQMAYDLLVAPGHVPDPILHPSPPSMELRVTPRSTAQVFIALSDCIDVPSAHIACGLAAPIAPMADGEWVAEHFVIHTTGGHKPPLCAYTSVRYRDCWYYIDDRDAQSKFTFAMVLQLSRFDLRRRPPGGGPLLTLPAGR